MKKTRYQENHKKCQKIRQLKFQGNRRSCDKVDNFLEQVKKGLYYICTIHHRRLYRHIVTLFKQKKYHILIAELFDPLKTFDENLYIV